MSASGASRSPAENASFDSLGAGPAAQAGPDDPARVAPPESPEDAYARLVRTLRELDARHQSASPRLDFRRSGGYAPESQAYLDALRGIARELVQVVPKLPRRELDHSQGFNLVLPHLGESRTVARALGEASADALRSGDTALFEQIVEVQRARVADSAHDEILISSLVGMSLTRTSNAVLREALSSGLVDAETAQAALAATGSLALPETYGIDGAIAREGEVVAGELAKLRDMTPEARAAELSALTGDERAAIVDSSLEESLAKLPAYFAEARAAMADPDRARGRAELDALERRALAGEFGGAFGVLPANLGMIQQRLVELLAETDALRADLAAIARGEKPAEAFMNAAELYVAAGKSLRALDGDMQREIEALRVAGDGLPPETRARALGALRSVRERIAGRLLRAARCERCDFAEGASGTLDREAGFLIDGVDGVAGAVRLMLVEPLVDPEILARAAAREGRTAAVTVAGHRAKTRDAGDTAGNPAGEVRDGAAGDSGGEPTDRVVPEDALAIAEDLADAATPTDRVLAALVAVRRYAAARAYGRSLVAQQIARDCADAVSRYESRGLLDDFGRKQIAEALATLDPADPFGFARALPRERERIAALVARPVVEGPEPVDARTAAFDADTVATFAPHSVSFVLGMCTPLAGIDPESPDARIDAGSDRSLDAPFHAVPEAVDGPFSDLRPWFDLAALREANGQREALRDRVARELASGSGASPVPFAGLVVTRPVDIDRRIAESHDDVARLAKLVDPTTPTAPTTPRGE